MTSVNLAVAEEITIAAASDLTFAFKELVVEYEKASGNHVRLTFGSSGNFYAQIVNGAPFDLYFSADTVYPLRLENAGLTVPGSLHHYAIGRIVLWTRNDSHLELSQGFEALRGASVKKIAIANPKHAPYGRAAVAAMKRFGVYDSVKDKLVLGENISQAAQFVESGSCDIGIVALSLARSPSMQVRGTYWEIPADSHPPLEQGAVVLKSSTRQETALQFLEFLKGVQGRSILKRYGFVVPESQ
jgi:molybdate transport system substrate-binding protein